MIDVAKFYKALQSGGIEFYAGVPDSLLKDFCAYVTEHNQDNHIIAANEGGAVGLAMGHYLATGNIPVVYMQNSGLGNTINPLLSMADKDVYAIPMVMIIGWRGEILQDGTQLKDEPQHKTQGRLTVDMLDTMQVPYVIIDADTPNIESVVQKIIAQTQQTSAPVAVVVRKGTFNKYKLSTAKSPYIMTREQAIGYFVDNLTNNDVVVSTTGMPSRELFEVRKAKGHENTDFLCVGGMGHASQIAVGVAHSQVAQGQDNKTVWCLDGDGAALMHMGALAMHHNMPIHHIILNNGAHDSVGGQPTVAFDVDLMKVAQSCGYKWCQCVDNENELKQALQDMQNAPKPAFLEIRVAKGNRSDLGRPTQTPIDTKQKFMNHFS